MSDSGLPPVIEHTPTPSQSRQHHFRHGAADARVEDHLRPSPLQPTSLMPLPSGEHDTPSLEVSMGEFRLEMSNSKFAQEHFPSPMLPDAFRARGELRLDDGVPFSPATGQATARYGGQPHGSGVSPLHDDYLTPSVAGANTSERGESCFSPNPHYRDRNVVEFSLNASPRSSLTAVSPEAGGSIGSLSATGATGSGGASVQIPLMRATAPQGLTHVHAGSGGVGTIG